MQFLSTTQWDSTCDWHLVEGDSWNPPWSSQLCFDPSRAGLLVSRITFVMRIAFCSRTRLSGRKAWCDMFDEAVDEAARLFPSHSPFLKLPLCLPFLYSRGGPLLTWKYTPCFLTVCATFWFGACCRFNLNALAGLCILYLRWRRLDAPGAMDQRRWRGGLLHLVFAAFANGLSRFLTFFSRLSFLLKHFSFSAFLSSLQQLFSFPNCCSAGIRHAASGRSHTCLFALLP